MLLLAVLVTACISAAASVPTASAFVTDPLTLPSEWFPGGDALGYLAHPSTIPNFGNGTFVPDSWTLAEGAEAVPAMSTVPWLVTLALGAGAFGAGWEIGSTLNNKWLHIAGVGITPSSSVGAKYCQTLTGSWQSKTAGASGAGLPLENGYVLRVTCVEFPVYGGTVTSETFGCSAGGTDGESLTYGTGAGGASRETGTGGQCAAVVVSPAAASGAHADQPVQDYTGQAHVGTSGWANPATGGGISGPAPGFGSGPSSPSYCVTDSVGTSACDPTSSTGLVEPVRPKGGWPTSWQTPGNPTVPKATSPEANQLRCALDAAHYTCPTPDGLGGWSDPGGAGVTWTMPACVGLTVAACEAAINAAADGANVTRPTYTELELDIAAADLTQAAGAVVITNPAGATVEQPGTTTTTVTIDFNPDPMPVLIPTPDPWVTGTAYCLELVALGLTCSSSPLIDPDPAHGPGELTHTTPKIGTRVLPGTPVVVLVNPTTTPAGDPVPYPPTDPNDPGSPAPAPAPACTLAVPGVDMTPLSGHSLSSKFPFAAIGWVAAAVGAFNVTGVAPVFDIPIGANTLHIDLAGADILMTFLRPILAGLTLIGAVWFISRAVLGFGGSAPTATGE